MKEGSLLACGFCLSHWDLSKQGVYSVNLDTCAKTDMSMGSFMIFNKHMVQTLLNIE
jgi:hypothetical protein